MARQDPCYLFILKDLPTAYSQPWAGDNEARVWTRKGHIHTTLLPCNSQKDKKTSKSDIPILKMVVLLEIKLLKALACTVCVFTYLPGPIFQHIGDEYEIQMHQTIP